jgi:hypothetical protein
MKGIVFNMLEECVNRDFGEDTWDRLLDACGLQGAYTSLGTYPDAELYALVGAACKALDKPPDQIIRWFGQKSAHAFAERYTDFFRPHTSARGLLLTLNDIIHPEVRKLYPGADVPEFRFQNLEDGRLQIWYRSARQLCAFAEGLILGTADYYHERATVEQPLCMRSGAPECLLVVSFAGSAAAA